MKKTTDKGQLRGTLLTLAGATCWGISGCLGQFLFASRALSAGWLVSLRLVVAGALLTALGFVFEGRRMVAVFTNRRDTLRLLVFAVFGMMFCQYTYYSAVQYANAGTATVLQTLSAVFILVYNCLRAHRAPRRLELVAVAGALTGTLLLATHGNFTSLALTPRGLLFGLLAAVGAMLYTLLSIGLLGDGYSTWSVVGFGMLFAAVPMWAIFRPWQTAVQWDAQLVLVLAGIITIGTAVAFSLYLTGAAIVGPLKASLLGSAEPLTAILISAVFLGARFTGWDLAGFALILATVSLLSLPKKDAVAAARKEKEDVR